MAIQSLHIDEFLQRSANALLIDVRSPGEYAHAHMPDAVSVPLFTDEERKIIGTAYKRESRENAVRIGLKYFGPRMSEIIDNVETLVQERTPGSRMVFVHCWRGGMRSGAVAWLLDLYGFKVYTLRGGYKAFRNWCLQQFEKEYPFVVVGGYTGSGKTAIIRKLAEKNRTVIDLEALASHRGSAFGNLGQPPQPTQEMFENLLAVELSNAASNDVQGIWVEDESQRIGDVNIPVALYKQIKSRPVVFVRIPFEERIKRIIVEYGSFDKERLANSIQRIAKRLGPNETKQALKYLHEDAIENCFSILLRYYDKWYEKSLELIPERKTLITHVQSPTTNEEVNAEVLIGMKHSIYAK